tara:strand:- start:188 stop:418 length:231 start_codon:yes stop_codon:yes gene_type:complete
MEKWKIDIEAKNLTKYERLCIKLIENYASKNRQNIDVFEERQIKKLLSRMFKSEYEYLLNEPEDYFELYGDDHLMN